jgi:N-acetyl-anhydromuramoyl-L-alanine amidase
MVSKMLDNLNIKLDIETGLLKEQNLSLSPNCNARPLMTEINLLVIHNISLPPGEFGGPFIKDFFMNNLNPNTHPYFQEIAVLKVSSHCLIDRNGIITQFVPFTERAWHAGESSFMGIPNCNNYSIGIELEGVDEIPYTDMQYATLTKLIRVLMNAYPKITLERIVGHSTIAPGRKTDPGPAFNWKLLNELMMKLS